MGTRPNIDYVYILGASHSGSTLLAMLLNAHPEIITVGETAPERMGDVDTYRCSCGKVITRCTFWGNIKARMRDKYLDFSLDRFGTSFKFPGNAVIDHLLHSEHRGALFECLRDTALGLSPGWRRLQQSIMARCRDLVAAVLAESGARIFVDSSKLAHRLKFLLRIPEFDIKVIHLVRDGRAVALTYMRQDGFADSQESSLRRGGRGMGGEATASSLPMKKAADEWRRCLRSAEHVLAGLERSRWMEVRYEGLCADPQGTVDRIYDFLRTRSGHTIADFRAVEHHVIGNGMRLDTTSEISPDERWRSVLMGKDLGIFNAVAGELNRRYGYR